MKDIKVGTKKMPNGKWSCYTTFESLDKAFVGDDISVVVEMANWLKDKPRNIIWEEPKIFPPEVKRSNYRFELPRLDYL